MKYSTTIPAWATYEINKLSKNRIELPMAQSIEVYDNDKEIVSFHLPYYLKGSDFIYIRGIIKPNPKCWYVFPLRHESIKVLVSF